MRYPSSTRGVSREAHWRAGRVPGAWLLMPVLAALLSAWTCCPCDAKVAGTESLTPQGGSLVTGADYTLTASYLDYPASSSIANAYLLLNTSLSAVKGADLWYDAANNRLWLRNDASSAWLGGYAPGSANTIENSYIKVFCAQTLATRVGDRLSVAWSVRLKDAMAGKTLRTWLYVDFTNASHDGWNEMLPYSAALPNASPVNESITPSSGSITVGSKLTVQASYSDPDGAANIVSAYLLLNAKVEGANGVYLWYDASGNKVYIRNDANTAWLGGVAPGTAGVVENSQFRLDTGETSVVANSASLVVNWRVELKTSLAGKALKGWLYVLDAGGLKDGWDELAALTPTIANERPVNVSISPSGGSVPTGSATAFSAVYTDPDGYTNIANCYLLLNSAVSGAGAIYAWYDAVNNKLYLRNDANTAWLGGFAPGTANVIDNALGTLDCAQTSATGQDANLTVSFRVTPKAAAAGRSLKQFMYVIDRGGLNDGWDQLGTVAVAAPRPVNQSLSPDGGDFPVGQTVTFTATYTHPGGVGKMAKAYLLLNTTLNGKNAIYVYYDRQTNKLYLRNDANTQWVGGLAPGAYNVIQNSLAWVDCEFTTVSAVGNTLTIGWNLYVKSTAPSKDVRGWMYVTDTSVPALADGWDELAVYGGSRRPANVSVDPSSGNAYAGVKSTLTARYSDPDGAGNLASAYLLLNTTLSSVSGCSLWYDRSSNKLYLRNDASTAWLGGFAPGSAEVLENSQCRVYCQETSASPSGADLTVAWRVEFKQSMLGKALKSWLYCSDIAALTDGWDQMGTLGVVTAPNLAPVNVSLLKTGELAVGNRVAFTSSFSDPNGAADISGAYLLLNETASGVNASYFRYDAVANKLYLRDDANTAWLGGYAPASGNVIENSSVKLYCWDTAVTQVGDAVSIAWSAEFKPSLAGRSPKGWMYVLDKQGLSDGWDDMGTFAFSSFVNQPPSNVSLSPTNASLTIGQKQTLTAVYSDPNGRADIKSALLLINSSATGANGILGWYDGGNDKLYLRDDANAAWLGGFAPGSGNVIENSRAKLYCAETSVAGVDQSLTIGWRIEPKLVMSGRTASGWLYVMDQGGLVDGYDAMATYSFPAPANLAPVCDSLTPATGVLVTDGLVKKAFKGTFSDANGVSDLADCYLLINSSLSQNNAMYMRYDSNDNKLYLRNDANTAWLGGFAPGTDNVISNTRVKLYCVHSTVTTTDKLEVSWVLEFMGLTDSNSVITHWGWTSVSDDSSATEAFKQLGAYSVVKVDLPPPPG